jgi:PIN domain nuclease of toxin-antitoxin system
MRLLLDPHMWLWWFLEPERLSAGAERAVADRANTVHLSPISTGETLVLVRKGRVSLSPSPTEGVLSALRRSAPTTAPLSHGIALRSETSDGFTSADPADRVLVATALEHELVLLTADAAMRAYEPVQTVW